MTDVRQWLKAGDPLRGEPRLDDDDARAMRRAVMARPRARFDAAWPQPVFVAVTIAVTLVVGTALGRRLPLSRGAHPAVAHRANEPGERRQLQFATPGGTRIIWTFHQEIDL